MRLQWIDARFSDFVVRGPSDASGGLLKKFVVGILILLLCSSLVSVAQSPTTPAQAAARAAQTDFNGATALHEMVNSIENNLKAMKNSSGLQGLGMYLVGFFFLLNFVWISLKGFFAGGGFFSSVLGDLVSLFVVTGVATLFLDRDVGTLILASLDTIAGAITGVGGSASVASVINESAVNTLSTLSNMWTVGNTGGVSWDISTWFPALSSYLAKLVACAAATFLVVLALCVYLATLITSQVSAVIALILAPLFVPFIMFQPASFMWEGWLRFLLGAGMMKIVGLVMLKVTDVIMASLAGLSAKASAAATGALAAATVDMVLYAGMILLAGLSAYLMAQVPSIATGLVSGGSGAGFSGWGNIASKSLGTRAITGGMQPSGSFRAGGAGAGGGGGGASAGRSQYGGQGLTNSAPNAVKPLVAAAGRILTAAGAMGRAELDVRAAKKAGSHAIGRDTARMSQQGQRQYESYLERVNAGREERFGKAGPMGPGHMGPPRPNLTVTKPQRSIDPKRG